WNARRLQRGNHYNGLIFAVTVATFQRLARGLRYERRGTKLEDDIADFLVHLGQHTVQKLWSLHSRSTLQQRSDFSGADGTFNILVIALGNRTPGFSGGIVDARPQFEIRWQISFCRFQRVRLSLLEP